MYFQPLMAIRSRLMRMLAFAIETHPPLVYALVAGGWSYSVLLMLTGLAGTPLPASAPWVAVVFFLVLLYLRAIDEIKDLPYDRLYNPDRPLVRAAITEAEVACLASVVAVLVLGLSLWLSPWLAALAVLQLAYGLGLLMLERASRRVRESILLNLCITFPVSAVLNVYAWAYLAAPALSQAWPVLALHMAAFLHMEFGRKLKWPQHVQAGDNGYAQALGVKGAVAVCVLLGLVACALASAVHLRHGAGGAALLPWLALLPSVVGLRRFWCDRARAQPRALKPWFGAAMVLFFLVNVLAAM
jgi:4-hydroxybenzoate polyprenyltransferase